MVNEGDDKYEIKKRLETKKREQKNQIKKLLVVSKRCILIIIFVNIVIKKF